MVSVSHAATPKAGRAKGLVPLGNNSATAFALPLSPLSVKALKMVTQTKPLPGPHRPVYSCR